LNRLNEAIGTSISLQNDDTNNIITNIITPHVHWNWQRIEVVSIHLNLEIEQDQHSEIEQDQHSKKKSVTQRNHGNNSTLAQIRNLTWHWHEIRPVYSPIKIAE